MSLNERRYQSRFRKTHSEEKEREYKIVKRVRQPEPPIMHNVRKWAPLVVVVAVIIYLIFML